MLEHTLPRPIRVAWKVTDGQLVVEVRDGGGCASFPRHQGEYRMRERPAPLGGDFTVEAVPGWAATLTARHRARTAARPQPARTRAAALGRGCQGLSTASTSSRETAVGSLMSRPPNVCQT